MSSFVLKIIAIVTMTCDHLNYLLYGNKITYLTYVGRLAFPIFAYQLVFGFFHTKNIKRYLSRLLIFAFISQIPFYLYFHDFMTGFRLNTIFELYLGIISIYFIDKYKNIFIKGIIIIITLLIAKYANIDYGLWGILVIYMFYFSEKICENNISKKANIIIYSLILCFVKFFYKMLKARIFIIPRVLLGLFTFLPFILILFHNGKEGKKTKYLFYIYYPLHLIILYVIKLI
jgi:hypothetical protein